MEALFRLLVGYYRDLLKRYGRPEKNFFDDKMDAVRRLKRCWRRFIYSRVERSATQPRQGRHLSSESASALGTKHENYLSKPYRGDIDAVPSGTQEII